MFRLVRVTPWVFFILAGCVGKASAVEPPAKGPAKGPVRQQVNEAAEAVKGPAKEPGAKESAQRPTLGDPPGATRLSTKHDVWLDPKRKVVIVDGEVCLREGRLEMFICLKQTKEHESILSANTQAYMVHAGLLALGAEPGTPVRFEPEYAPATGTEIEITLLWIDQDGKKQQARAQDWIRDNRTKKPLAHNWVFAGSGFWVDEETKQKHYLAEGGDFVCVSNFPTAMLDLPVESSQSDQARVYEAITEKIPPLKTKVRIVFTPKLKGKPAEGKPGKK